MPRAPWCGGSPLSLRRATPTLPRGLAVRNAQATTLTLAAAVFGLVVTVFVATDLIRFEYRNFAAHLVLDTADACVALLVAYLVYGRVLRNHRRQDLLLLQGVVLLGLAELGPLLIVPWLEDLRAGTIDVWLPLAIRVTGVLFLTAAALTGPAHRLSVSRRWGPVPAVVIFAFLVLVLGGLSYRLPVALDPGLSPTAADGFLDAGHPLLIAALMFSVVCFGLSAIAFTWHARRTSDQMLRWLGPACAVATFSRVNYVLFPSLYSQWLYSGDLLRTAFYLLLLVGAAREIRQHWNSQVESAVVEDRRRLARELHDGVLQELNYIRAESRWFREVDADRTDRINGACDRALDEARQAVEALGSPSDEPLGLALHRAVHQVADRHALKLDLDLDDSVTAYPDQRHALLRIVREAVSNAARHGGAGCVKVQLAHHGGSRQLLVEDDGRGFDVVQMSQQAVGFGLTSMRERADSLPGKLELESTAGRGTTIKVTW